MLNETTIPQFPKSVLDQANAASRMRVSSYLDYRLDLRGKTILSFAEMPNGNSECAYSLYRTATGWQLGVHVADVCEYVCENSPMDIEAKERKATVQKGFSRVNMLPDKITEELCNLGSYGDKLAISCIFDIDSNGVVTNTQFEESVIRIVDTCIYSEIDELLFNETSSVALLRSKYTPYIDILTNMYELAASFCVARRERGGLDCTYFRKIYDRDKNGEIIGFKRISEPDSRAMLREIGYFVAEAVGKYMHDHKLPCVFNGRESVDENTLDYLSDLVGLAAKATSLAKRTAEIADLAKGTSYYGFVCDALAMNVPRACFSIEPINNAFCGRDTVVSFFNPVSRYTDLIIQRILKTAIKAKAPRNLNLNKEKKVITAAVQDANSIEEYIYNTRNQFTTACALSYIKNNIEKEFVGFPVHTNDNGDVLALMECGVSAVIPYEFAKNYSYSPAQPQNFRIYVLGDQEQLTQIQPIV